MYIGAIDCGVRTAADVSIQPKRWVSAGVSMGGDVTVADFARTEVDVPVMFKAVTGATMRALKTYLMDTIKPFGQVNVTPDSSADDLGIGAAGQVALTFIGFSTIWNSADRWDVSILLRYYGGNSTI
jgi:hypothetical protein